MSYNDIFDDSIISKRRKGDNSDPYVQKTETLQILNGKVVLSEIPNRFEKVLVSGLGITMYETEDLSTLTSSTYKVDYMEGVVFFHSDHNGKSGNFNYLAEGRHFFPSNAVWVTNDANGIQTAKEKFSSVDSSLLEQKNRVDNLITETPQPDEVVDMRVDKNGLIYNLAKDRIDAEQRKIENAYVGSDGINYTSLKDRFDKTDVKITSVQSAINTEIAFQAKKPNTLVLYNRALEEMGIIPQNSLKAIQRAIDKGVINVAFVGDSITEGADQNLKDDAYAYRFEQLLRKSLPNVTVNFMNFGLSSRNIRNFNNPEFKALESDPTDRQTGFQRSWSTVGKSWRDHVKDFNPDLLVVAFGMNETGVTNPDAVVKDNLKSLEDFTKTWTTIPYLTFVTSFQPAVNYTTSQVLIKSVARAVREYGRERGIPVADPNRLYNLLHNGYDDVSRESRNEGYFWGYNTTKWSGDKTSLTLFNSILTPTLGATNKFVTDEIDFYNGEIEVSIKHSLTGTAGNAQIQYRKSEYGHMMVMILAGDGNGRIALYHTTGSSTQVAAANNLTISVGVDNKFKIVADGAKHQIYMNDVLMVDTLTYYKLHEGDISLGSDQTVPTFKNLIINYKKPLEGNEVYTEAELMGDGNSQSGNGINHPSGMGHALFYIPALYGLLKRISNIVPFESAVWVGKRLTGTWSRPSAAWGTVANSGEYMYLLNMGTTPLNGLMLKRLDTNEYYPLSSVAVTQATMKSLEPKKIAYVKDISTETRFLFITVTVDAPPSFEMELFRYESI